MKTPSFGVRLRLALSILGDPALAQRVLDLRDAKPPPAALPPKPSPEPPKAKGPSYEDGALVVLSILQREGRFLDFVSDDVASASDGDVAAAARVVHEGCRAALKRHVDVVPLRDDAEGAVVTVDAGYDANATKLTGNVSAAGPTGNVGTKSPRHRPPPRVAREELHPAPTSDRTRRDRARSVGGRSRLTSRYFFGGWGITPTFCPG